MGEFIKRGVTQCRQISHPDGTGVRKLWDRHVQETTERGSEEQEYRGKSLKPREPRKRDDGGMGPEEGLRQLGASPGARWERDSRKIITLARGTLLEFNARLLGSVEV